MRETKAEVEQLKTEAESVRDKGRAAEREHERNKERGLWLSG